MRRPFPIAAALILAAGFALAAAPAAAQSWEHNRGYDHQRGGSNQAPSAFDWRGQLDRPGDYRCDAFWDANRTDCGARWLDQRHRVSPQARRDYRALAGYGGNQGRYGQAWGYGRDNRYSTRRRGYGHGQDYGYGGGGHGSAGTAYHGAYGRPDLVYPGGGRGGYGPAHGGGRDPGRVDWCRAAYRSYDARTGYYRAYSGRLIFCG
jgi:hypothetical protein